MHGSRSWVVALLGGYLLIMTPRLGLACSPAPPDPWFSTRLQINGAELPPEIVLFEAPPLRVMIQNQSGSPLEVEVSAAQGQSSRIVVEPGTGATVSCLEAAKGFVARDDRPVGVEAPPPDHLDLWLRYDETVFSVPVTILYELNPDYRAGVEASGFAACEESEQRVLELAGSRRRVWLGNLTARRTLVAAGAFVAALLVVVVLARLSR